MKRNKKGPKRGEIFNVVMATAPGRNLFDMSHDVKLSGNMGNLIPIMAMDVIPGDKVTIGCESMVRLAPMVAPMMHRCNVTMHYFFVPNRILWPNFEKYISNTPNENTGLPYAHPYIEMSEGNYTKLADYMGIPNPTANGAYTPELINALPFAAYQRIWFDYYRDQNLQNDIETFPTLEDGNNESAYESFWGVLRKRAWEHDYLTSCLPFAQKGPSVGIPLTIPEQSLPVVHNVDGTTSDWNVNPSGTAIVNRDVTADPGIPQDHLYVDLEETTADSSITDLRTAWSLQTWLEKLARGGSRYIELIRNFFGVQSSDKRLQRPEYITGIKTPIMISEVLNTTGTEEAPQGAMAGHGISVGTGDYKTYFCEEHGWIIGIMSVMPTTAYWQGIPKKFLKVNDPYDYFWPQFAHVGEQEVKGNEVMGFNTNTYKNSTFGYIPRYTEYRFEQNRVAGDFRSSLKFWHMGREFNPAEPPGLNAEFIECDPTHRVFAVTDPDQDKLWCHVYNKIMASRPIPKFGTPASY